MEFDFGDAAAFMALSNSHAARHDARVRHQFEVEHQEFLILVQRKWESLSDQTKELAFANDFQNFFNKICAHIQQKGQLGWTTRRGAIDWVVIDADSLARERKELNETRLTEKIEKERISQADTLIKAALQPNCEIYRLLDTLIYEGGGWYYGIKDEYKDGKCPVEQFLLSLKAQIISLDTISNPKSNRISERFNSAFETIRHWERGFDYPFFTNDPIYDRDNYEEIISNEISIFEDIFESEFEYLANQKSPPSFEIVECKPPKEIGGSASCTLIDQRSAWPRDLEWPDTLIKGREFLRKHYLDYWYFCQNSGLSFWGLRQFFQPTPLKNTREKINYNLGLGALTLGESCWLLRNSNIVDRQKLDLENLFDSESHKLDKDEKQLLNQWETAVAEIVSRKEIGSKLEFDEIDPALIFNTYWKDKLWEMGIIAKISDIISKYSTNSYWETEIDGCEHYCVNDEAFDYLDENITHIGSKLENEGEIQKSKLDALKSEYEHWCNLDNTTVLSKLSISALSDIKNETGNQNAQSPDDIFLFDPNHEYVTLDEYDIKKWIYYVIGDRWGLDLDDVNDNDLANIIKNYRSFEAFISIQASEILNEIPNLNRVFLFHLAKQSIIKSIPCLKHDIGIKWDRFHEGFDNEDVVVFENEKCFFGLDLPCLTYDFKSSKISCTIPSEKWTEYQEIFCKRLEWIPNLIYYTKCLSETLGEIHLLDFDDEDASNMKSEIKKIRSAVHPEINNLIRLNETFFDFKKAWSLWAENVYPILRLALKPVYVAINDQPKGPFKLSDLLKELQLSDSDELLVTAEGLDKWYSLQENQINKLRRVAVKATNPPVIDKYGDVEFCYSEILGMLQQNTNELDLGMEKLGDEEILKQINKIKQLISDGLADTAWQHIQSLNDPRIYEGLLEDCPVDYEGCVTTPEYLNENGDLFIKLLGHIPQEANLGAELKSVTWLDLDGNQISDVTPLKGLTHLTTLDLKNNQISDFTPLKDLTQLTSLNLDQNQISVFTPLKDLTQLYHLHLGGNQISDVTPLKDLTHLDTLSLGNNQLTDVKGLGKLTQLKKLYLNHNKLTELPKGLEKLSKLTYLELGGNKLTDVKGLEKLTQLTIMWLFNNPDLTKAQIAELKKALPQCTIYSNPTK